MLEQKQETLHQKQSKEKPSLEVFVESNLNGELKQAVIDFMAYCKENKISYPWGASNNWYLKFKGKRIGHLRLRIAGMNTGRVDIKKDAWILSLSINVNSPIYKEFIEREGFTEIIWENVKRCEGCLTTCAPGRTMTILEKDFDSVCIGGWGIWFINPNAKTLDCFRKLMDFQKSIIISEK